MSKIWLIARREYLTRVRNKTFLLSTFLLPLVIILFIAGSVVISIQTKTRHRIAVVDPNGYFKDFLKSDSAISFDFSPAVDTLNYEQKGCTAVLIIPPSPDSTPLSEDRKMIFRLKYKKQLGMAGNADLEERLHSSITDHLIAEKTNVSRSKLDSIRHVSDIVELHAFEDLGSTAKASSQTLSYIIGYTSGLLIYILTFIYGAMVMRGVMEEKTNRIAEVIVSSVKPFQLMMGKITGIGAVGLTQFLLWVVLMGGLAIIAQGLIPHDMWKDVEKLQQANAMGNSSVVKVSEKAGVLFQITSALHTVSLGLVLSCFLFYFIGGYLFYSALFAAVGSAVNEDAQEAQSLMMPITLPVIFSFLLMSVAIQDPAGSLAIWASIIPFSSPIVMMARIPFGVPWWQLGLSMLFLILGFLGTTWLAGKIYRTGILMYGKKANWKTMWKWAFRRQ